MLIHYFRLFVENMYEYEYIIDVEYKNTTWPKASKQNESLPSWFSSTIKTTLSKWATENIM